jgi:hypothetical protein
MGGERGAKMYFSVHVKYLYLWVEISEIQGTFLEFKFRDRYAFSIKQVQTESRYVEKYFGLHVKCPYFLTHLIETGSISI